uniref:DNA topoisomerase n=1 Tax=Kwoniella dejecticola CBS 10117 TaxID=1296121 RepID=A0A1A6ACQ2_9TREE|nr:DNA topoisomerase III [Kwoniella dejecticola CBS 10117]OBR87823.1 DNA topoisomerase III [Kwoniella dejecticola CBS 10117]
MKVLCVAEKPSIAKSITEILSGGRWDTRNSPHPYIRNYDFDYNLPPPLGRGRGTSFTVTAVLGHLMSSDFGEDHRKWHSCDPFALFDAPILTSVSKDLKQVEQNLINEARHSEILMIWTDCDREGEHIGSEVASVCRKVNRNIIVKRARFSAIIAAQIHQAARQANELDQRQADAVEARMALDLRIGAVFTRFMTMGLQVRVPELAEQLISYGPCQFPTLGFVVDQYNRVQSFVPEIFGYIYVGIERTDEEGEVRTVEFKWRRNHLFDMDIAAILYEQCAINPDARVLKVETKPTTKWYPLPLTTVELQQSGSRLLRMAPKRVLDIAEKLYQKGILSYPRTETDQYDRAFDFNSLIQKQTYDTQWGQYAQRLLDGAYQGPRNGKKNDKAHPPIHPTSHAGNLEGDERRVFELVTRRFLASCSKNAEGKTTTVEINIADEFFHTGGLVITQRNYLEVYPYDKWSDSALPDFQEGEMFTPTVIELKEGSTSKPSLLTEADLVGLMDKNGIGTDATIAEHIAKIIERQYVLEKQEQKIKYLVPSQLGVGLIEGYNKIDFDRSLSKPHLRRETEHRMQLVCDGLKVKREILDQTIEEYKEVFIKAKRDFDIVIESVNEYLHGRGEAQEALRAATQARRGRGGANRGGRGGRGGGAGAAPRRGAQDDDEDSDEDDAGPPRGGGRGRARAPARGTSTRGRGSGGGTANATTGSARKRNHDNSNGPQDGGKTCDCDMPAVSRTVQKADSPHVGRQFWTCSKPQAEQCGYFEWADEGGNTSKSGTSGPSRRQPPAKRQRPISRNDNHENDDDEVRCKCDLEARFGTVNKEGPNKGKQFWACPNNPKASCGFFQWAEDGPGSGSGPQAGPSNYAGRSYSRNSNNASGGGGGTSGDCFKCGQAGHWSNACPNDSASGGARGGPSRAGSGGGAQSGECFRCGQIGHWSNSCPNDGPGGPSAPTARGGKGRGGARGRSRGRARGR